MRVLLTNDDGVHAAGLHAVRHALVASGAQVVTVAPVDDCSGFARRCTFSRPVTVRRLAEGPNPIYAGDGSPVDCVRIGLLAGLAAGTDVVVSGINHGANLADDVLYSGTVGAGLEASLLGVPAVCLSQQTPTGSFAVNYTEDLERHGLAYDFSTAAQHAARLLEGLQASGSLSTAQGPRTPGGEAATWALNVNYPAALTAPFPVTTRPGLRRYPPAQAIPWQPTEVVREIYMFGSPDEEIPEIDVGEATDLGALRAGRISITPLLAGAGHAGDTRQHASALRVALTTPAIPRSARHEPGSAQKAGPAVPGRPAGPSPTRTPEPP